MQDDRLSVTATHAGTATCLDGLSPCLAAGTDAPRTSEMLRRAREGDQAAWGMLYQQYRGTLRSTAERSLPRSVRGSTDGEDVVQDVFLRVSRHLRHLDVPHEGAFLAYLRRAVINKVVDEVRRSARVPARVSMPPNVVSGGKSPLQDMIGREQLSSYRAALIRLGPREREILKLRVDQGLPYHEVARQLGIATPDAARVAGARALRHLAAFVRTAAASARDRNVTSPKTTAAPLE
jgi:RNA polymerase sigma factor (sigma-70 family)